jgi:hypothetical protein
MKKRVLILGSISFVIIVICILSAMFLGIGMLQKIAYKLNKIFYQIILSSLIKVLVLKGSLKIHEELRYTMEKNKV